MAGCISIDWRTLTLRQLIVMYEGGQSTQWDRNSELMSALDCLRFMLHVLIQKDSKRRTKIAPPRSAEAFNPYRRSKKGSGQKRMKLTPQNLKLLKPMVEGSKKYSRRTIPY